MLATRIGREADGIGAGTRNAQGKGVRARLLSASAPAGLTVPAIAALLGLAATPAVAQDATWVANPTIALGFSGFNLGSNWDTGTVPTGTGFFNTSTGTQLLLGQDTTIGGLTFNPGASNYTLTHEFPLIGGGNLTFTGAGIVINGGSFTDNINGSQVTFFKNSSSAGSAAFSVSGQLLFQNTSTAATATIGNGGTVGFQDNATAGSAAITNDVGGLALFADNATAATSNITNSGTLTFQGSSTAANATITNNSGATFNFNATSTAASASITNSGTLSFANTATAGHATISNNLSGVVNFNATSTASTAVITNRGSLNFSNSSTAATATIGNNGAVSFANTSTAAGATVNNFVGGNIAFGNSSTAANAHINNSGNNAILEFDDTSTAANAAITNNGTTTFANNSTAGSANITNSRTVNFLNASTAANAVITNNGSLNFRTTSTAGNAAVTNNGNLAFFNDSTGGNASVVNTATGTVDFSASTGPAGDGKLAVGSIAGAGAFYFGSRQVTVGGNNTSTTVDGVISDCGPTGAECNATPATGGSLVKAGTGTLTLAGVNTYTGATLVNGGTLLVNGSIVSSATVNAGGILAGTGTVGNVQVTGGGIFAPGSGTPGTTMTVAGNLAMSLGSIYQVALNPTTASGATVTGTAALNNATALAQFANGSYVSKTYTILTAGSVSGTFVGVATTNLPTNFSSSLSYDSAHVYLNLSLDFNSTTTGTTGTGGGTSTGGSASTGSNTISNPDRVAATLVGFFNRTGGIPFVFGTLNTAGLTQLSGESATGSQQTTFQAMGQFMGLLTDPFMGRGNGVNTAASPTGFAEESAEAYAAGRDKNDAFAMFTKGAPFVQRWSVWAAGYGGSQTTDGNAVVGSNDTRSSVYGTAVGADYLFSPDTLLGFAVAGGGTNFSVNNLGGGRSDLAQAGVYARHIEGNAYVTGALAYGWQDVTTNRTVTAAGFDQLRAEFHANAYSGRVEGGYRFVAPAFGIGITPYAAGQFTTFDLPSYSESVVTGSPIFALAYAAKSVVDTRSELGFRGDDSFAVANGIVTLRGRLAWAHDFNQDRSVGATFQALPGASFVVNGAAQASDSALTTAALEMKWLNGWSAAAKFEGEFSDVTRSYAGTATVRYAW
jgi:uncharacterized protein with beta-barrel porin domain